MSFTDNLSFRFNQGKGLKSYWQKWQHSVQFSLVGYWTRVIPLVSPDQLMHLGCLDGEQWGHIILPNSDDLSFYYFVCMWIYPVIFNLLVL